MYKNFDFWKCDFIIFADKNPFAVNNVLERGCTLMPRRGENIYKRKDGRWEGRYIKGYYCGKAKYGYVYAKTYSEVKQNSDIFFSAVVISFSALKMSLIFDFTVVAFFVRFIAEFALSIFVLALAILLFSFALSAVSFAISALFLVTLFLYVSIRAIYPPPIISKYFVVI